MARLMLYRSVSFSLWLAMAGTALGQATVEYGLGAARAATTAAPGKAIGKAMSGLAGSLDKALKAGQQGSDAQATPASAAKPAAKETSATAKTPSPSINTPPPPAPNWEDPKGISTGLGYDELVRRFGPPALEISGAAGRSLTYTGKDGTFQLEVQDGKVTSIEKPKP
jgi:hypothetical protein